MRWSLGQDISATICRVLDEHCLWLRCDRMPVVNWYGCDFLPKLTNFFICKPRKGLTSYQYQTASWTIVVLLSMKTWPGIVAIHQWWPIFAMTYFLTIQDFKFSVQDERMKFYQMNFFHPHPKVKSIRDHLLCTICLNLMWRNRHLTHPPNMFVGHETHIMKIYKQIFINALYLFEVKSPARIHLNSSYGAV